MLSFLDAPTPSGTSTEYLENLSKYRSIEAELAGLVDRIDTLRKQQKRYVEYLLVNAPTVYLDLTAELPHVQRKLVWGRLISS